MAPLSADNLKAPFTNRVHLVTIIGVSVAFATFRMAGGNLGTAPKRAVPRATQAAAPTEQEIARKELSTIVTRSADTESRVPAEEIEGDSMVSKLVKRSEERTRPTGPSAPAKSGGLDEIEKNLGLR